MYPGTSDTCQQCGNFFWHIWWDCGKIRSVWKQIHNSIQQIIRFHPRCFYLMLSICKLCLTLSFANLLTAATQLIAGYWKLEITASLEDWYSQIRHVFLLSKLSAICKSRKGYRQALEELRKQANSDTLLLCSPVNIRRKIITRLQVLELLG